MEIIIRKISQRCSGVLRKNKELRQMQFYILIRDEEWEHVGEIKTALLDTLGHKYLIFPCFLYS